MSKLDEDKRFFDREIMGCYNDLLYCVNTVSKDRLLAADIVQETMETAWEKLDLLRTYTSLKCTLATIAKNKLMNYYRKNKVEVNSVPLLEDVHLSQKEEDFIIALLQKEERRQILMTISKLRQDYIRIILMHYYYDLPLREVAQITNTNYNTVVCWHRRALKNLARLLVK